MILNTQRCSKKSKSGFSRMICLGWTTAYGLTLKIKHILQSKIEAFKGALTSNTVSTLLKMQRA